ncbi:MAG: hypothetical protein RJQ04_00330 [Longimicrobiales bacterium]
MATKTDEKVMQAVEAELKKNPDASVDDLYAMAVAMDKSVSKLSKRQFHARYPLQVKRKMAPAAPKKARNAPKKPAKKRPASAKAAKAAKGRDAVREIFLDFALELASAEDRKNAVRVVAGVDRWVDRVVEASN